MNRRRPPNSAWASLREVREKKRSPPFRFIFAIRFKLGSDQASSLLTASPQASRWPRSSSRTNKSHSPLPAATLQGGRQRSSWAGEQMTRTCRSLFRRIRSPAPTTRIWRRRLISSSSVRPLSKKASDRREVIVVAAYGPPHHLYLGVGAALKRALDGESVLTITELGRRSWLPNAHREHLKRTSVLRGQPISPRWWHHTPRCGRRARRNRRSTPVSISKVIR